MCWFLKTHFSGDCSESSVPLSRTTSSGQLLATPTVNRWHKYLWLSTSTGEGRVFSQAKQDFQIPLVVTAYLYFLLLQNLPAMNACRGAAF